MIVDRDVHPEFGVITARCREIVTLLCAEIPGRDIEVAAGEFSETRGKLYRLSEGLVKVTRHGRMVWCCEESDLFGLDLHFWSWDAKLTADFQVRCREYDIDKFLAYINGSPARLSLWTEYLALQTSLAHSVLSVVLRDEIETVPTVRAVEAGETIIKQGELADTVYTLIEGKADVLVDGVKVGEVLRDEIFGALAAFNGGARTASVITTENSLVVSLPLGEFSMLVESRPRLVVKLIQDLARAISALNSRVVDKF